MSITLEAQPLYHLYTYFRSSCSARVLIAARLMGIRLTFSYVDLGKGEHHTESFKSLNPSESVPVLVVHDSDGEIAITQLITILEYLEEISPRNQNQVSLLPPTNRPKDRAKVRELVGIIATDVFPPINGRIAQLVRGIRGEVTDQIKFVHQVISTGFTAYELMLQDCSGKYSFKDVVTMADVCL